MKTLLLLLLVVLASCRETSYVTSWDYNNPKNGGFQKVPFLYQETAPGMTIVAAEPCLLREGQQVDTLDVPSFYLSKYEETNAQYLTYLEFLKRYYSESTWKAALPDTTVWNHFVLHSDTLDYFTHTYLRSPEYANYPVVGLTYEQIERYAQWKTDRMNEYILIREGLLANKAPKDSTEVFTTPAYLRGDMNSDELQSLNPKGNNLNGERIVRMEDGILLPPYRLPTSEEWLAACLAVHSGELVKTSLANNVSKTTSIPYFRVLRDPNERKKSAARLNYGDLPQEVYSGWSNAFGIQCMEANVAEIVNDSTEYTVVGGDNQQPYIPPQPGDGFIDSNNNIVLHFDEALLPKHTPVLVGFRLAMDRYGQINPKMKRAPADAKLTQNKKLVRQLKGAYTFSVNILGYTQITSYLRLYKDGTFYFEETMDDWVDSYNGSWKVIGDKLICTDRDGDKLRTFPISGAGRKRSIGLMKH